MHLPGRDIEGRHLPPLPAPLGKRIATTMGRLHLTRDPVHRAVPASSRGKLAEAVPSHFDFHLPQHYDEFHDGQRWLPVW
jgi:hypothetical protein